MHNEINREQFQTDLGKVLDRHLPLDATASALRHVARNHGVTAVLVEVDGDVIRIRSRGDRQGDPATHRFTYRDGTWVFLPRSGEDAPGERHPVLVMTMIATALLGD